MSHPAPLDTTIAVVTPENIAFEYQLAGPFRRLPAYLIDFLVQIALVVCVAILLMLTGWLTRMVIPGSFLVAGLFIAMFLINWFYGTIMETYYNGRTIGKWMCGLRTIRTDGRPIDGTRALIRNLLRVADLAPPPAGIVGLVAMLTTRRLQRLGDLAAGTMVVVDERVWRLPVIQVDDPRAAALATFIPGRYRVSRSMARALATYVERRAYLTPARRRELARHLADPLIERFGFRPDVDPDLLMLALYQGTFLVDARQASAERGPYAGHSPLIQENRHGGEPGPASNGGDLSASSDLEAQR